MTESCGYAGCGRPVVAHQLCMAHYQQKRRTRKAQPTETQNPTCSIAGCVNLAKSRGYCHKHYDLWYRKVGASPKTDPMTEQICQVFDCTRNCKSRGLCDRHYSRYYYRHETQVIETVDEFIQWDADRRSGPTSPLVSTTHHPPRE